MMEGLIPLRLLVLLAPSLSIDRDYHFVGLRKTWTEARDYCRENFLDLATVENLADWENVRLILGNSGHRDAWIGLYDDVKSWRWSRSGTPLYDGGKAALEDWFVLDNAEVGENCGVITTTEVGDIRCEIFLDSVCYDEPSDTYVYVTTHLNWTDAQSNCRRTYTDLASVRNQQEKAAILSVLPNVQDWRYWVGLFRNGWRWSDQSNSSFRAWGPEEPSGGSKACGSAGVEGWMNLDCSEQLHFICSAPKRKIVKVVLKTAADPNDLVVQEALLKQMEKPLSEQAVEQKVELKWRKQASGNVFNRAEL